MTEEVYYPIHDHSVYACMECIRKRFRKDWEILQKDKTFLQSINISSEGMCLVIKK